MSVQVHSPLGAWKAGCFGLRLPSADSKELRPVESTRSLELAIELSSLVARTDASGGREKHCCCCTNCSWSCCICCCCSWSCFCVFSFSSLTCLEVLSLNSCLSKVFSCCSCRTVERRTSLVLRCSARSSSRRFIIAVCFAAWLAMWCLIE